MPRFQILSADFHRIEDRETGNVLSGVAYESIMLAQEGLADYNEWYDNADDSDRKAFLARFK